MKQEEFTGKDDYTRNLLQKAGMEEPSADFTSRLMEKIAAVPVKQAQVYQPVISARGWFMIIAALIGVTLLTLNMPASAGSRAIGFTSYIDDFQRLLLDSTSQLLGRLSSLSSLTALVTVVAAGWLLYAADKFIRKITLSKY